MLPCFPCFRSLPPALIALTHLGTAPPASAIFPRTPPAPPCPQDCNPLQVELALLLAGPSGRLTVVGDDDQSIYGFMAATPAVFDLLSSA